MEGKPVHEWGPWERKHNVWGEALSWAERRCVDRECHAMESQHMPNTHELLAMTRRDRRQWERGKFRA
jgi:hypothetical protein